MIKRFLTTPVTVMIRFSLCASIIGTCRSQAVAIEIWLSSSDMSAEIPVDSSAVPTPDTFVSQGTGSLFVWARPDTGKTLAKWSLRLTSSNPTVLSFDNSEIEPYNLLNANGPDKIDDEVQWEFTHAPAGDPMQVDLFGLNIGIPSSARDWKGIGPTCQVNDQFCDSDTNSWVIAKINYTILGDVGDSTDLNFQIGSAGINHLNESSSAASVVFGDQTDNMLNGLYNRWGQTDHIDDPDSGANENENHDARIVILADPVADLADFDSDLDVDGRDFLIWQLGLGLTGQADNSTGDATNGGAVDQDDLAAWQVQYGPGASAVPLAGLSSNVVPEPTSGALTACLSLLILTGRRKAVGVRYEKSGGEN